MKLLGIISNGSGRRATFMGDDGKPLIKHYALGTTDKAIQAEAEGALKSLNSTQGNDGAPPAGSLAPQEKTEPGDGAPPATPQNGLERLNLLRDEARALGIKPLNVGADALEAAIKEAKAKQPQEGSK